MPERPALLDPRAISDLAGQLDSPAAAVQFLENYLAMLPGRLERILTGLKDEDHKVSMDAVLSLKISSAMNGASEAAACCRTLETLVRRDCFELARSEAVKLSSVVTSLCSHAPHLLERARASLGLDNGCEDALAA